MSYTLNQYIHDKTGSLVEGDTADNRGECVGLVEEFYDIFNLPHIWGNAKDMPANADRNTFDVIPNSAAYVPPIGAAAVFPGGWGGSSNGHIGLVAPGTDANTLVLFEANDRIAGGNGSARLHSFDYSANPTFIVPKIFNQVTQPTNQGDEDMIKPEDRDAVRIVSSEIKGWDFNQVHSGELDAREMAAWVGHPWTQLITEGWQESGAYREQRQAALAYYAQKAANDTALSDANDKIGLLTAQVDNLQKQLASPGVPAPTPEPPAPAEPAPVPLPIPVSVLPSRPSWLQRLLSWLKS